MASRVRLPSISFIVARSYPGNVIGFKNKLPWHIKSDLKRFRSTTTGHAIIMGRSTFESIGRALPDRANIVMTRSDRLSNNTIVDYDNETQLYRVAQREDALFAADVISICRGSDALFVIGGEKMYSLFDELVNRVYLTEVFGEFPGDAYFKKSFPPKQWKVLKEEDHSKNYDGDDFSYRFSIFQRRERRNRYAFVSKFFTDNLDKFEMLKNQVRIHKKNVDEYVQRCLEI
jgi:dihydrofolate reductase